jgi:hypothetical protein
MEGREWEGKTDEGKGKERAVAVGGGGEGTAARAAFVKGGGGILDHRKQIFYVRRAAKLSLPPAPETLHGAATGRETEEMERLCS